MVFEFQPTNITKDLLLKQNSEEAYFAHYLGVNPTKGLFRSPLRKDDNPTCSFYRNKKGELIFKDFGDGFHGNFINVVMTIFKVPYYKAISIIANDFGIIKKPHYTINLAKAEYDGEIIDQKEETMINVEIKDFTENELAWWLSFGITESTLKKFKVFSIKNVFLNGSYMCSSTNTNPIYGYYFGIKEGRELWKIYFPRKRKFRFLLNTNTIQGLKQLPKDGKLLVITKSLKDVMSLYELGITAIAPQSESVVLPSKIIEQFKGKGFETFIVNGDWDNSGKHFMYESRKSYPCICLSFKNKEYFGKDISDFIEKHGFDKARSLINKLKVLMNNGRFNYQLKYFERFG